MKKKIIETVLELLSNNSEWEERYAKYIKYLKDKQPKRFKKPEGLSVYSSVSAYKGETYDLRFEGQSVGLVVSRPNEVLLYPRDEANEKYFGFKLEKDRVDWHSSEATKFRRYFRDRDNEDSDIKLKSPEHRVENCLLK